METLVPLLQPLNPKAPMPGVCEVERYGRSSSEERLKQLLKRRLKVIDYRQHLNNLISLLVIVLMALAVVGCGGEDSEQGIPVPDPPNENEETPLNTGDPNSNDLPDLSETATINLIDTTAYSGLDDLGFTVVLPTVGDQLIELDVSQNTGATPEGTFFIGFEDAKFFRWATLSSFPGTGNLSPTFLDMIFQDDLIAIRVLLGMSASGANGTVYYRKRVSDDEPCMLRTNPPSEQVLIDQCKTYMNISNSEVKTLGTFNYQNFQNWID